MSSVEGKAEVDLAREPLTCLQGVGPVRAVRLAQLGFDCLYDLLVCVPLALNRQGELVSAQEALLRVGEELSVKGRLAAPRIHRSGPNQSVVSVDLEDASGKLRVLFFNQSWMKKQLEELRALGNEVEFYGKLIATKSGVVLSAASIASEAKPLPKPGSVVPIYRLTEGIGQGYLAGLIHAAITDYGAQLEEPLQAAELGQLDLPDLQQAVAQLNRPSSGEAFHRARRRLSLEKLLAMQASLLLARQDQERGSARSSSCSAEERDQLLSSLPHVPTTGQQKVMHEILDDLGRSFPMARLLQGDVGAGKTMVAQCALAAALKAGGQVALLAPTELLAEQHFRSLSAWFEARGQRTELLSGSLPASGRRATRRRVANGQARLVVGTHALFSAGLKFQRLDLVVIDEQQRFGVLQKASLLDKGAGVHTLLMTATPIPRTLALSIYGDLDVSLLAEKPPGRGSLKTHLLLPERRQQMIQFIDQRLTAGEHVFWVRPRIDEDSGLEPSDQGSPVEPAEAPPSVEALWHELRAGPLWRHGIEAVHGRMEGEERERRLERFRSGAAKMLLGTTIVEVGVDVPQATIMVIEGAERFGLSQLHQLRGRVGRGSADSWCFLLGKPAARERLQVLQRSNDGFQIAEQDLQQRGMGDLGGVRQAGGNVEGLEDPITDLELVLFARRLVEQRADLARRYGAHFRGRVV